MQILELGEVQLYRELCGVLQEIFKVAIKLIKVTLYIMYCTGADPDYCNCSKSYSEIFFRRIFSENYFL